MKQEIYECDRCYKKFEIPEDESPTEILKDEAGKKDCRGCDQEYYQYCDDCNASFAYWMLYHKEFDALADKLARKETGESTD